MPGNKPRSPKFVTPNVMPVTPVTDDAVIGPGAAVVVSGRIVKPMILIWSWRPIPPAVILIVIAVLKQPPPNTFETSPPPIQENVGQALVQNSHPVGGIIVIWSPPTAKSALDTSSMIISPRVVQGGVGPQSALPPEAGVTLTAKPKLLKQQKRKAKKNIFEALTRPLFPLTKAVKNSKENFFIIIKKVFSQASP